MFCARSQGKDKQLGGSLFYSIPNSKLIEITLVRAFSLICVTMGNKEHDYKKIAFSTKTERNWSPLLKFYVFSWYYFHLMSV